MKNIVDKIVLLDTLNEDILNVSNPKNLLLSTFQLLSIINDFQLHNAKEKEIIDGLKPFIFITIDNFSKVINKEQTQFSIFFITKGNLHLIIETIKKILVQSEQNNLKLYEVEISEAKELLNLFKGISKNYQI